MITYKLHRSYDGTESVTKITENSDLVLSIPFNPKSTNYQEYLAWLAEGNEPEPADEPETP